MQENKQNENHVEHEQFKKRCLQLASEFGTCVENFEDLPEKFRDFFACIGYTRVCSFLIICDLKRGRSERELAGRYGLTRKQIEGIKENSRLRKRRKKT